MIDFLASLPEIFEPPVLNEDLHAPVPYFGGKRRAAGIIWDRIGDVTNWIEVFCGSCAVTLARPAWHTARVETCNDIDALVVNFWRATAFDPENVARIADWPVFEVDLHARHKWLIARRASLAEELEADPFAYDLEAAAWWAWGASCWIGTGWCSDTSSRKRPDIAGDGGPRPGKGVHSQEHRGQPRGANAEGRVRPALSSGPSGQTKLGQGVHAGPQRAPSRQPPAIGASGSTGATDGSKGIQSGNQRAPSRRLPDVSGGSQWDDPETPNARSGKGVHRQAMREPSHQLPDLGGSTSSIGEPIVNVGKGLNGASQRTALYDTFARLAARLRYVRFPCGDWSRVVTPAVTWKHGLTGMLLDPTYDPEHAQGRTKDIYAHDSSTLSSEVRAWAREAGARKDMRIAICGYEGEHDELLALGWSVVAWKAQGGYGNQAKKGRGRDNSNRERIWFSPHCVRVATQTTMF